MSVPHCRNSGYTEIVSANYVIEFITHEYEWYPIHIPIVSHFQTYPFIFPCEGFLSLRAALVIHLWIVHVQGKNPAFLGLEPPLESSHKIQQLVTEGWIAKMVIRCRSLPRIRIRNKNAGGFINPTKNCDFICCMALYGFIWFYMVLYGFLGVYHVYYSFIPTVSSMFWKHHGVYDMILRDFTNKVRGYQQKQTGWPPPSYKLVYNPIYCIIHYCYYSYNKIS